MPISSSMSRRKRLAYVFHNLYFVLTDYFRESGHVTATFSDRMETTSPEMEAAAAVTINRAIRTRASAPRAVR